MVKSRPISNLSFSAAEQASGSAAMSATSARASNFIGASVQPVDVRRERLDLAIAQLGGDGGHHRGRRAVHRHAALGLVTGEHARGVLGVLAADAWIPGAGIAVALRAVTALARRQLPARIAGAIDLL